MRCGGRPNRHFFHDFAMKLSDKYAPQEIESKWYDYWMRHRLFHSEPDEREPYTIVIPPPNVTGVLHMGHILNNTIQDVLTRRARMLGKNACWVPGTDHASIATEAKVVAKLKAQGIEKTSLTREEFLKHAWEWTEEHGGLILKQLRRLGASCDWDRTVFTLDEPRYESVIKVFVDLYNKGMIYRGVRMVNWDPAAQTALSDEEVIYKEMNGKLYYLRYKIEGSEDCVIVATTRPETILGDTGLAVNPNDPRYASLKGKKVIVPLVGRAIPVVFDDYVDVEFGTGALKVTPAHDVNDYVIGEKFGLEAIDVFNDDGTVNGKVGMYEGMDRFALRDKIEGDLAEAGLLEKVEAYTNKVGCSERTGVPIEPKLSMQWWLKMEDLARPALKAVMDDDIRFFPTKFKNTYRYWMENIKDWCISRQLWWGQRIPAWYMPGGGFVVAEKPEEALAMAREKCGDQNLQLSDLRQDEDVLDTWFSSWLWPISVFDGIRNPDNKDVNYYYPTNDLVTGPDIIFFWVARMIMSGYQYRNDKPFGNVYFTGIVRDKLRRKMSKSLGNSPEPLELIADYGADGVRTAMLLCTSAGNDLMFDESLCEQGRNFGNKIWNAYKLVSSWKVDDTLAQNETSRIAVEWFGAAMAQTRRAMEADFTDYRISEALMQLYKLFWDDFSGWFLEMVKPPYGEGIDTQTLAQTKAIFEQLLQLLHPFMPFITEEIWQHIAPRKDGESIMTTLWPAVSDPDERMLAEFEKVKDAVSQIRAVRKQRNIPNKDKFVLKVIADENFHPQYNDVLVKMGNLSAVEEVSEKDPAAAAFMVKTTQYFIPLEENIDKDAEVAKLREELAYQQGFLKSVMGKLSNERFVSNAPAKVVENEKAKKADAEARIAAIEERLSALQ